MQWDDTVQKAAYELSRILQDRPLNREVWLQFIFEGDATQFPPNFSMSREGHAGMGGSSLGGRLSMDGTTHIEIRCDADTFSQVVHGHLPLDQAISSKRLTVTGGRDIWGNDPNGGLPANVRRSIIRQLATRLTRTETRDRES